MLSKPECGWTYFQLEGTRPYDLSYLDDIPLEWLDQAIYGLETLSPFCVHGNLEPGRMLCLVSYWNCHIIVENDERYPLAAEKIIREYSHTSMLEFCKLLHKDISACLDDWTMFVDYSDSGVINEEKKKLLSQKLDRLEQLISEKEERFDEKHCFW